MQKELFIFGKGKNNFANRPAGAVFWNRLLLFVAIISLSFFTPKTFAQQPPASKNNVTVTSYVKDDAGNVLSGARIYGNEGARTAVTDTNGQFTISVTAGSELLIEADGHEHKFVAVSSLDEGIVLKQAPFLRGEKDDVHILFDNIKRADNVNAIDVINPVEMLKVDNTQHVQSFLTGRINATSNLLNLRGLGTALVLVDGVPRDLNALTTEEIDQITVLRDINAVALYGTQAKNGVILVTTKRGGVYKRRIKAHFDKGVSSPVALPKYLGSADYMKLYNEALANDGLAPVYNDINNYESGADPYRYPDVDYYSSEFLRAVRPTTRLGLDFSGGNKTTQYYANMGWLNTLPLYKAGKDVSPSRNRLNLRANVNVKLNDYIKTYIDGAFVFDIDKQVNRNFWTYGSTLHPYYFSPLLPIDRMDVNLEDLGVNKTIDGKYLLGGTDQYQDNVYGDLRLGGYAQHISRTVSFNNGIDFDLRSILPNLSLKTQIGIDIYNDFIQRVANSYAVYKPEWNGDRIVALEKIGQDRVTGEQILDTPDYYRKTQFSAQLDYFNHIGDDHFITATLLGYYGNQKANFVLIDQKPAHIGLRLTYDYAKKYFANFSGNYAHSILLPRKNRNAFSPTIGLAWVVSEEDFMPENNWLDYLKLKLTGGILNTDRDISGHNLYKNTVVTSDGYNWADGKSSLFTRVIAREANPQLTFEKVENVNVGLEGYLFSKSLRFDANWFYTRNSGIIIQRTTYPALLSTFIPYENYNANSYTGAELSIGWTKQFGDFSVDVQGNIMGVKSKVEIRDEIWEEPYLYRKGLPVDAIFGMEALGLFADANEIAANPTQEFGVVKPGDIRYKNQNSDNVVNIKDMKYLGNYLENFSYGLNITLKYKNFSLFAAGHGIGGGTNYYSGDYFWVDGANKYSEMVWDRWTPATAATATYPRLSSQDNANNFQTSTFWIYKRTFFNVDRIQLTYELPTQLVSKIFAKQIYVYLRGDNIAMAAENARKRQLRVGAEPDYSNYSAGLRVMF